MSVSTPFFDAWLDRFFESYYVHRPVNATFIGVHEHDGRLPDYSESGCGDELADAESLLREGTGLPDEPLTSAQKLDRRMAIGWLRTQLWELRSTHFQGGNPSHHTGEAVFGMMALLLSDFAPLDDRLPSLVERMEGVPTLLRQARDRVATSHPLWTVRAIRECRGAIAFLTLGVEALLDDRPRWGPSVGRAAARAAAAFEEHRRLLGQDLLRRPNDAVACGEEVLDLYIREGHFLKEGANSIADRARDEMEAAERRVVALQRELGAAAPHELLSALRAQHPSSAGYLRRYRHLWDAMRELALDADLLTWPDFPIRYLPRPEWARAAAPDLYFLFYRSPAAFGRPPVHDYLVQPIDSQTPPAARRALLEATNEGVIKLNHVIHHGGIGHHVQNWHAFQAESRIGRIAAVDCASRVAMFSAGTMAEGWACYATDLMAEFGGLTRLEAYAEARGRVRMCARAIVDVEIHSGRMSLTEAAAFYQRHAGMPAAAAVSEAVKNSMFPGAALMYMVGTDAIHALRAERAAEEGRSFSLRTFHDELLSFGSVPVALVAEVMGRRTVDGGASEAHTQRR